MEKDIDRQQKWMKKVVEFVQGDTDAVRFLVDLTYVLHLWDDLVDRDNPRSEQEINQGFRIALVDIPRNPFYLRHLPDLRPLMMNVILQWQDANQMERKGNHHDLHMAYMLRAGMLQVFNYCAYLVGGPEWAEQVGPDMRRLYQEDLFDYMQEFKPRREEDA